MIDILPCRPALQHSYLPDFHTSPRRATAFRGFARLARGRSRFCPKFHRRALRLHGNGAQTTVDENSFRFETIKPQ
ncbi:hypothetical protein BVG79_00340 [Ketogulonicigenium robustum]|uniref:Uncharacterized protein n=1 Tax=Ketogulonicigenium robustum TaxID=92947 RepID=A0A1W6NWT0_9RHOB|nr:hypothetical protein BVG79_00340 [Ketogulonicigenium robustum]